MPYLINIKKDGQVRPFPFPEEHGLVYFDKMAKQICEMPKSLSKPLKSIPSIDNYWVTDYKYNAIAEKSKDGKYSIGINFGTLLILQDLFFRLLANPKTLIHIGDVNLEQMPSDNLDYHLTDFASKILFNQKYNEELFIFPKDPIRRAVANYLTDICFQFVLQHELAHIICGHLDFLESRGEKNMFLSDSDESALLTVAERHTLEMDADSKPVNYFMNQWIDRYKHRQDYGNLSFLFSDPYIGMFHLSYAFYMTFRVFGPTHANPNLFLLGTHPPTRMRQHMIICTMSTILLQRFPEFNIVENAVRGLAESWLACEIDYQNVTGVSLHATERYHHGVVSIDGKKYLQTLTDTWIELYPFMKSYAFREPSPPEKNYFMK